MMYLVVVATLIWATYKGLMIFGKILDNWSKKKY